MLINVCWVIKWICKIFRETFCEERSKLAGQVWNWCYRYYPSGKGIGKRCVRFARFLFLMIIYSLVRVVRWSRNYRAGAAWWWSDVECTNEKRLETAKIWAKQPSILPWSSSWSRETILLPSGWATSKTLCEVRACLEESQRGASRSQHGPWEALASSTLACL